jgi:hypothetical protein
MDGLVISRLSSHHSFSKTIQQMMQNLFVQLRIVKIFFCIRCNSLGSLKDIWN